MIQNSKHSKTFFVSDSFHDLSDSHKVYEVCSSDHWSSDSINSFDPWLFQEMDEDEYSFQNMDLYTKYKGKSVRCTFPATCDSQCLRYRYRSDLKQLHADT